MWNAQEEDYLRSLSQVCQELSQKFKVYHEIYLKRQFKFRIPSIVISSITGLASFGTTNFPKDLQNFVSIGVGASSIFIAILNSIESYMKIGEIISGTLQSSINFQKLKEQIDIELSLPIDDRAAQGIVFVRECYAQYEKYWDLSPHIMQRVRFIKPIGNMDTTMGLTPTGALTGPTALGGNKSFVNIDAKRDAVFIELTPPPKMQQAESSHGQLSARVVNLDKSDSPYEEILGKRDCA
jgi:hypothetical protein